MTLPLVSHRQEVESRIVRLQQRINLELGFRDQRLRFHHLSLRSGETRWKLRDTHAGPPVPLDAASHLADASNDASMLFFAYNEAWIVEREKKVRFDSSNLRFVIGGLDDTPPLQFRLEWAGAAMEGDMPVYQGKGAAHPHWQFDVGDGWPYHAAVRSNADDEIVVNLGEADVLVDLDGDRARSSVAPILSATLEAFAHLHLPSRAIWHEPRQGALSALQHQHTPTSGQEIDDWVIAALVYVREEFKNYL